MADLTLLYTPASPFARKVRMVACLRNVELSLCEARVHPAERNVALGSENPLAKIPVLLSPDGALFDSRVICRYLDAQGEGNSLYPPVDPWRSLRLEALADGIMDAAVLLRYELVTRPADLVWPGWVNAQTQRIEAALDWIVAELGHLDGVDIGTVSLSAALTYLDFRHGTMNWWSRRQGLRRWLDERCQSYEMQTTSYPQV